jgi:hypothetical protein
MRDSSSSKLTLVTVREGEVGKVAVLSLRVKTVMACLEVARRCLRMWEPTCPEP